MPAPPATSAPDTVAVVSASPALASILAGVLSARRPWRVRRFATLADLATYRRIAPVAVIVSDFQFPEGSLDGFARTLSSAPDSPRPAVLALVKTVDAGLQRTCLEAGIDEVIVKPMSPAYIEERVAAHLARPAKPCRTSEPVASLSHNVLPRAPAGARAGNVVSFAAHKAAREAPGLPS